MVNPRFTKNFYEAVYELVLAIPAGRVATYGQVATYLGSPRAARAVGYALLHVTDPRVPWHRVINAAGKISEGGRLNRAVEQMTRLKSEKVEFDGDATVDLRRYRWQPTPAKIGLITEQLQAGFKE